MTVLIAGAASRARAVPNRCGHSAATGRIVVAGDEPHPPYERPALSKALLAGERHDVELSPRSFWAEQDIELLLGRGWTTSTRSDARRSLGDELVGWDAFVHATGVAARRLAGPAGVHHLRSLDDARALASELRPGSRVVVVGAGFIGEKSARRSRAASAR